MMKKQQQEKKDFDDFMIPNYTRLLAHFKNSLHQGFFKTATPHREGPGITFMDNTVCVLGSYKNDQINGQTLLFLSFDTYAIADFNKGMLDGPFVIRSPQLTIYSQIKSNKIDGEILIIDYSQLHAQLWTMEADGIGQLHNQLHLQEIVYSLEEIARNIKSEQYHIDRMKNITYQHQILKSLAPYMVKAPSISEFLKNFKFYGGKKQIDLMPGFMHRVFKQNQIIYLADQKGYSDSFLGVAVNKRQEIIAIGCFERINTIENQNNSNILSFDALYHLNGLGLSVSSNAGRYGGQRIIQGGQFMDGRLCGDGYRQIIGQRSIYGKFAKGEIREIDMIKISTQGDEQAKRMYLKRVKSIHIHSLGFINNYANQRPIFMLKNIFRMVAESVDETNQHNK